jgi:hypothetical protein
MSGTTVTIPNVISNQVLSERTKKGKVRLKCTMSANSNSIGPLQKLAKVFFMYSRQVEKSREKAVKTVKFQKNSNLVIYIPA